MIDKADVTASSVRTFVVDTIAPAAPTVTSPLMDDVIASPRPTLTWNAVAGASSYTVNIQNATTLADVVAPTNVTGTSFTPTSDLPTGSYVFRIRSNDQVNASAWTQVSFNINPMASVAPTNLLPANNGTLNPNVGFSWDAVAGGPYTYDVQVSSNSFATLAAQATGLTSPTYIPPLSQSDHTNGVFGRWIKVEE